MALKFNSLVAALQEQARTSPEKTAVRFLENGETESQFSTYAKLCERAQAIAAKLQLSVDPGERVLIVLPSSLDFIEAFFGCLFAKAIAVPVYVPTGSRHLERLLNIIQDCQAAHMLTNNKTLALMSMKKGSFEAFKNIKTINLDEATASMASEWQAQTPACEDIAFLQYTSGSTGEPKGVMVTHKNILTNVEMFAASMEFNPASIMLSWLPMFHDMGLVGSILGPIIWGFPTVLMPPSAFLEKPQRWLKAIGQYKATVSGAPNFAFDLCVKKISSEGLGDLDLSSLKVFFNGSEPISARTMTAFSERFSDFGFREEMFFPCYGLAETTLFVAGGPANKKALCVIAKKEGLERNALQHVSSQDSQAITLCASGKISANEKVKIVHPETKKECSPDQIGEIWVAGGHVAKGYFNKPDKTREVFCNSLGGDIKATFLRTGDLGFFYNEQLFVCGRLKDLIILNGVNHYPQDIEDTIARNIPSAKLGGIAAFSMTDVDDKEHLEVAVEVERSARNSDLQAVGQAIALLLADHHEVAVRKIYFIKPGHALKTSSGKIQRQATRRAVQNATHEIIEVWQGRQKGKPADPLVSAAAREERGDPSLRMTDTAIISSLQKWFAEQPETQGVEIGPEQPLTDFGIDSVTVVSMQSFVSETYDVDLPQHVIFEKPTLRNIAEFIQKAK